MNIAIDGPAGAGKSTIAKRVSKKLGYVYVDTGAMYRTMALYFLRNKIDGSDEAAVSASLDDVSVEIKYVDGEQKVLLNKEDVTGLIRTEEVGNMASATSKYSAVREKLLELQRDLARKMDVVMDGRDIGTTILPDAEVKIYLTASVDARGQRRYDELKARGVECDLEQIKKDIEDRDYRDMHREVSPLKQAADAYYLDSSDMDIDEVTEAIIQRIKER
ncbi:MAG: (d)CMP kinase [Lachnospiraceae bacterium]|nr:(d)CMP kinase [Lachnospiraceae bacterium]